MTISTRKPRQRCPSVFIKHEGKRLPIGEWAKEKGVHYQTIWTRHHQGYRGEALFQPSVRGVRRARQKAMPVGVDDCKQLADANKAAESKRVDLKRERLERKRAHDVRVAAEWTVAMTSPLIDGSLLTAAERQATHDRIKYSGQRSWRMKGESL